MKTGIFTDSHYSSQEITCGKRYNSQSLRKIREALQYFQTEGCELVICLGDLIDHEGDHEKETRNLAQIAEVFREFMPKRCDLEDSSENISNAVSEDVSNDMPEKSVMKIVSMMGNHDAFTFTRDEFYSILGEEFRPETIIKDGKKLMFPDTCYFSDGRSYSPGDTDWINTFLPGIDTFEKELQEAPGEVILFMHQNIDPEVRADHLLSNASEVRKALESSGKVKTVYQGHYHPGHTTQANGIRYVTYPAMCELEGAWFVVEI